MSFIWACAAGILQLSLSTLTCGDEWVAPALDPLTPQAYCFTASRGAHIVFETFADPAAQRPVNPQVELFAAGSTQRIAFNDDKAFGDLQARLASCIAADGAYVLVVSVSGGGAGGPYRASFRCSQADLRQDSCSDAGEWSCGALFYENSSACLQDDFDAGPEGCTGYAETGGDAVLGLRVEAGWELEATLVSSADAALYLVRDCVAASSTCVAGADDGLSGEAETLRYRFPAGGRWFLVLDHHGGGQGVLRLTGTLACDTVAVQPRTWTQVRRLYRE